MSAEAYNGWSLFFQFFTAVGTVGAVIVSLYLSRDRFKPKFIASCEMWKLTNSVGEPHRDESCIKITACNVGIREDGIQNILFTFNASWWSKVVWAKTLDDGDQLPHVLQPGEHGSVFVSMDFFIEQVIKPFAIHMRYSGAPQWLIRRAFYPDFVNILFLCQILTTRYTAIKCEMAPELRQMLKEEYLKVLEDDPIEK